MVKLNDLRVDPEKAELGVWVEDFYPGIRLRIAKYGNPRHIAAFARIAIERRGQKPEEVNLVDDEKQAAAEALLVGWEGVDDDDGTPIPYSPEKALELFRDPTMQELWAFVRIESIRRAHWTLGDLEETEGN